MRHTAEEVGALSDAAVLHEALEAVRGVAPDERRALVAARAARAQTDAEKARGRVCGAASYADLHAPHGESCNCSDCRHDRRNDEWIAGVVAAIFPRVPTCQACGHQEIDADAEPRPRCRLCRTDWNWHRAEAKQIRQAAAR